MGNGTAGVLQHSPIHYVLIKIPNSNDAISVQHMNAESFPSGAPHYYIITDDTEQEVFIRSTTYSPAGSFIYI